VSQKFLLGRLLATPAALEACAVSGENPFRFIVRHARGDWGDLSSEDRLANERALEEGTRLLSAYHLKTGQKVWIITEWDRSATTVLLPEDY
jgi:hypothetical protein